MVGTVRIFGERVDPDKIFVLVLSIGVIGFITYQVALKPKGRR